MKITINTSDLASLDRFAAEHPNATAGHRAIWPKVLEKGLGHKPYTLTAWRDGQVVGFLPLVETRSLIFGRNLVSLPYLNEAGVLADELDTKHQLIQRTIELGHKLRVRRVELRNRMPYPSTKLNPIRTDKVRMLLPLPTDTETLWTTIGSKTRNLIRKAEKNNLTIKFGGSELLSAFYHIFSINMRDLGTPVFPRVFFKSILHHLKRDAEICIVSQDNTPISAALLIHHGNTTEVPSASALRAYNHTACNMLMYWHLLKRAVDHNATRFDFGRSTRNSGTYKFKKQWGALPYPTGWQQYASTPSAKPTTADDDQFKLAISVWKKLPVWVTRLAGPQIVKGIP